MNEQGKYEKLAQEVATKAHLGQFRNDGKTPYIKHPGAVVNRLREFDREMNNYFSKEAYKPESNLETLDILFSVGWLHDVLEDTSVTKEDLLKIFPVVIVDAVVAVTKLPKGQELYLDYLKRVRNNDYATRVKRADLEHNMSDLKPGNLRDKYELTVWFLENYNPY